MKAAYITSYDGADALRCGERPDPKVGPDVVLIRVAAASINPVDCKVLRGYMDWAYPSVLPLISGWDVAGTVEAVGPAVKTFKPGDAVVAYARKDLVGEGSWAELVAAPLRTVAHAPTSVDLVHAACLPLSGLTAFQAIVEELELAAGEKLLIHAAGGGVGSFAVQIARALGAHVYGTGSESSADRLRELGAEPLIYGDGLDDQLRQFEPDGVDAVLDLHGGEALEISPKLLNPKGRFVSLLDPPCTKELGGRYLFVRPDANQLSELVAMVDNGTLRIDVEETFELDRIAEAVRRAEEGHTRGKLVLTVGRQA